MELWLTGGSHYSTHQGTKWIPMLFKRLSRNKMQVTAQGLRHHVLLFLSCLVCWSFFFVWRTSSKFKMSWGRGSLSDKFWSCHDWRWAYWLHKRGSREMKAALAILALESSCSLHPHNGDVTSVEEMQRGELPALATMSWCSWTSHWRKTKHCERIWWFVPVTNSEDPVTLFLSPHKGVLEYSEPKQLQLHDIFMLLVLMLWQLLRANHKVFSSIRTNLK